MFGHPKDNFLPKKARLNFEVYGQNNPITPEAGGKKAPFSSFFFLSELIHLTHSE